MEERVELRELLELQARLESKLEPLGELALKLYQVNANSNHHNVWLVFLCSKTGRAPEAWMLERVYRLPGGLYTCHVLLSDCGGPKEERTLTFKAEHADVLEVNRLFDHFHRPHTVRTRSGLAPRADVDVASLTDCYGDERGTA